jgi:hypothetical protein
MIIQRQMALVILFATRIHTTPFSLSLSGSFIDLHPVESKKKEKS